MSLECPIHRTAAAHPDSPALLFDDQAWSYRRMDEEVGRWAAALAERQIARGDRVAVLCANRPELVFLLFAARRLGAALVPFNFRLTSRELEGLRAAAKPKLVLADPELTHLLRSVAVDAVRRPAQGLAGAGAEPEQTWVILFTSGTTGSPKGAELTVGNFLASARASGENLGREPTQRWLCNLPLFHVGAIAMATRCAEYGAALVLEPRFDAQTVAGTIHRAGVTHASFVPQTLRAALQAQPDRWSRQLKAILLGGASAPAGVLEAAARAGLPVLTTYGLTEATSQVCTETLGEADGGTCGRPLPGLELRIVDPAGRRVPPGVEGELQLRGPTVMKGYFGRPAETAQVLAEGWLRTGDLGRLDARGRLCVLARRTDLLVSGGENVYPAEVETVLAGHPSVQEAVVVPAPDDRWGEVPVAFFVGAGPVEPAALQSFCRERLAKFKVPRHFVRVAELPRNAMGKADRAQLRRRAQQLATDDDGTRMEGA